MMGGRGWRVAVPVGVAIGVLGMVAGCTSTGIPEAAAVSSSASSSASATAFVLPTDLTPSSTVSTSPAPSPSSVSAPTTSVPPMSSVPATASSAPSTPRTTAPTTTAPPSTRTVASTPTPEVLPSPCPSAAGTATSIVTCLQKSTSDFWSGTLNEVAQEPIVLSPSTDQVPEACRPALQTTPAFTCQIDGTLYVTHGFVVQIGQDFRGTDQQYAFASLVSHEIGHVVQGLVGQPGYTDPNKSNALSQQIEQQADCLSGVWAASEVKAGRLDADRFVADSQELIALNSTNPEIATHGTPPVRAAAIRKGLSGGRPQSCNLATFS
jgi:uncharacterized protein